MDKFISTYETNVGPLNGAKVVAKAWTDPEYRERLLADGTAAIAELGFKGPQGEHIVVVANDGQGPQRRGLHAVLVLPVAGARPAAELVQGPGLPLAGGRASRARCCPRWASTSPTTSRSWCGTPAARCASSCCPQRPAGTEVLSEEQLAALVTRDAMVGVAVVRRHDRLGRRSTSTARPRRRAATASWSSPSRGRAGRSAWRWRSTTPARSTGTSSATRSSPGSARGRPTRPRASAGATTAAGSSRSRTSLIARGVVAARRGSATAAAELAARPAGYDHDSTTDTLGTSTAQRR